MRSLTASLVTSFIGRPPPPKSRSRMSIPPIVDEAVQTVRPVCASINCTLTEIRLARPHMPVVMMTGYGSEALCASALRLGVRDYFPKPVNVGDLLDAVRRVVSEASSPGEGSDEELVEDPLPVARRSPAGDLELSIQKAIGLIQLRYWDNLSLAGLARELGMSKYHLSRRFKEATGVTFRGYVLRTRLERAKVLLSRSQDSITEVAHVVGFGDLPRFDKLFKRYTGLTPSAYRARPARGGE